MKMSHNITLFIIRIHEKLNSWFFFLFCFLKIFNVNSKVDIVYYIFLFYILPWADKYASKYDKIRSTFFQMCLLYQDKEKLNKNSLEYVNQFRKYKKTKFFVRSKQTDTRHEMTKKHGKKYF